MRNFLCIICLIVLGKVQAQETTYHWDWEADGITVATSSVAWGLSHFLRNRADKITFEDLNRRDPQNIWPFDRGATSNYSLNADDVSNYLLYGSFVLPFTHYLAQKGRNEGFTISGMLIETLLITNGSVNVLKALTKRYRPYTYNEEVAEEDRLSRGARYSFPSGHVSATAALSFFTASIYVDLYPSSKWKKVVWGTAILIPTVTGIMKYEAGKHYPTDIIIGYGIGAAVGFFIPKLHKKANEDMSIQMVPSQRGFVLAYSQTF